MIIQVVKDTGNLAILYPVTKVNCYIFISPMKAAFFFGQEQYPMRIVEEGTSH
jgi:hypothetical protein